jgi:type I restriction enzyme S subunit
LKLLLRTKEFLAAIRFRATGHSGRKRVTSEAFLDLAVPLPAMEEERRIVAAHDAALARAAKLEREAEEIEKAAVKELETALGFTPPQPLSEADVRRPVQQVRPLEP